VLIQSWDRLMAHENFNDMDYLIWTVSSDFTGFIPCPGRADREPWDGWKDALHRHGLWNHLSSSGWAGTAFGLIPRAPTIPERMPPWPGAIFRCGVVVYGLGGNDAWYHHGFGYGSWREPTGDACGIKLKTSRAGQLHSKRLVLLQLPAWWKQFSILFRNAQTYHIIYISIYHYNMYIYISMCIYI
jgi:hypothetical protein